MNAPIPMLDQLLPGDADTTATCTACNAEGACRDWVECMAEDANVPAEWLAEMVISKDIDHTWGVEMVTDMYRDSLRDLDDPGAYLDPAFLRL